MNERLEGAALYRAMVKVWDPAAGEWVVTAEAVDTLEGLVSWAALGVGASAESRGGGGKSDPFFALVAGAAVRVVSPPYRAEDIALYVRESFGLSDEELVSVVPVAGGESSTWSVLESFMWREEQGGLRQQSGCGGSRLLAGSCPTRTAASSTVVRADWLGD